MSLLIIATPVVEERPSKILVLILAISLTDLNVEKCASPIPVIIAMSGFKKVEVFSR